MTTSITDDVGWLNPCVTVDGGHHLHVSSFVVSTDAEPIVIDTGSVVHWERIERELTAHLRGGDVGTVLLTHTDLPHGGNLHRLLDRWPDADVAVGTGHPELQGLPDRTMESTIGERVTVEGREIEFVDPPLADRSLTNWILDRESGVLFTGDGFGSHHAADECAQTSREFAFTAPGLRRYHETALPWLRYVTPAALRRVLADLLDAHDVAVIAPSHGPPIYREDFGEFVETFTDAVTQIADRYAGLEGRYG